MDDLLKQFLPDGMSLSQNWTKLAVWAATPIVAWLVTKTGMPEDLARWVVIGTLANGGIAIYSIAHAQANRLKGAAQVVSAQHTGGTPDTQVNVGPGVNVTQQPRPAAPTAPAPVPVPEPTPQPAAQVVHLTPAQLAAFGEKVAASILAKQRPAPIAQQDTVAGQPAA